MSIQFNFFAAGDDALIIHEAILEYLGPVSYIPDRGSSKIMSLNRVQSVADFADVESLSQVYLVPVYDFPIAKLYQVKEDLFCVALDDFACLEYCPSAVKAPGVIVVGRFAYFYRGDENFKKMVQRLYRYLKKRSRRVPNHSWYIFENAARTMEKLDDGGPPLLRQSVFSEGMVIFLRHMKASQ